MNISRRRFLRAIPALALLLGGAPAQGEARETVINRFCVAGFQYYQGQEVQPWIRPGETLRLIPEPGNPHDRFAVEIYRGGSKLGYVPRSDNRHISRLLRDGVGLACRVEGVGAGESPWNAVRVTVSLLQGGPSC